MTPPAFLGLKFDPVEIELLWLLHDLCNKAILL